MRLSGLVEKKSKSLDDVEQYSCRDCIEIAGVPESEEEDTNEIVVKVAWESLLVYKYHMMIFLYFVVYQSHDSAPLQNMALHVSAVGKHPKIIIKFVRRATKERFYHLCKQEIWDCQVYLTIKRSCLRASPQKIRNYLTNV